MAIVVFGFRFLNVELRFAAASCAEDGSLSMPLDALFAGA